MQSQSRHPAPAASQVSPNPANQTPEPPRSSGNRPQCRIDLEYELNKGFAAKLIRQKTKQLVGHFGLTASDRKDLEQEFKLALLERFDQFAPEVANWEAFATLIVEHRIVTLIEERWAEKREYRHNLTSLSTLVPDPDGELVELSQQIGEEHLEKVTGVSWPHHADEVELEHDVAVVFAKLPAELRELAERLKHETVASIARDVGVSRRTLRDRVARLRAYFEADDLREYLEK